MNVSFLLGVTSLAVWALLVFVGRIPAGWIHIPLPIGVLLIIKTIVESGTVKSPSSKT
jgi:uncharacterized membrane protein